MKRARRAHATHSVRLQRVDWPCYAARVSPRDRNELAAFLADRCARAEKVPAVDLCQLNRVLELTPEDMTVTVEAGLTLAALQRQLAAHGQWLPIDPPHPDRTAIHEVLAQNLSGPRRFGYGTVREHLIGMKVVLADGRTIKSGGKVVKNVAGYDLAKLFIGARDSLGIIVEATFKVQPLPEQERFVARRVPLEKLGAVIRAVLDSALTPVVLDAHGPGQTAEATRVRSSASTATIVLGFAGTREEVEWQLAEARSLGFDTDAALEHETSFWSAPEQPHHVSVLPSRLGEIIAEIRGPWLARAGNGLVHYRGEALRVSRPALPAALMSRVKQAYDPKNILPELSL